MAKETIRINEPRTVTAGRVTVNVKSRPIEHVFDDAALGEPVARAIRDAIAEGIRAISAIAAPATLRYRAEARRALERGAAWAERRFGSRPPDESDRLFNDSGELAAGVVVEQLGDTFKIGAPADRTGVPGSDPESMWRRLRELVPAIANPLEIPAVRAAIEATWSKIVRRI